MSVSSSSTSSAARCTHFGTCGGCSTQNLPYDEQLRLKAARVSSFIKESGLELSAVHASPDAWHYRNKMEFSFGDCYPPKEGDPWLKLGLKPKGRWYEILDLQHCFLPSPEVPALLASVRTWAEANRVPPYVQKRRAGVLRHLVLREAKNTNERMVLLVTEDGEINEPAFVEAVTKVYPATTILRGINKKASDTAVSDSLRALTGPGFVTEELDILGRKLRFRISPHSFFQTNSGAAEVLYTRLVEWARESGAKTILDLYCGGGAIALCLAPFVDKVVGAELNPSAVADAKENAALNKLGNASFFSGDVSLLLPSLLAMGATAAVVDPPRAGLMPKAAQALVESGPETLLYVSCNPESLGRDLKELTPYKPLKAELFDLFPHTDHVETLVLLRRERVV
jgi:23S rRNA (uracil1939-C5)-methyltransferase